MSINILSRCPLFSGLNDSDLWKVRSIAVPKQIARKGILFSDGDEARGFYVILSGRMKLFKISPEGKEQILHILSAPEAFGEAALFLEGKYPAFAEALTDCKLLFFPKEDFVSLIEKNPRLSINMIVSLSLFLKKFVSLIEELSLKEVSSRVAKYLIDLSLQQRERSGRNEVELDISKNQLALRLGTVSETLSRTFAKMKAKGIVDVQGRRILIKDRRALETLASGAKL